MIGARRKPTSSLRDTAAEEGNLHTKEEEDVRDSSVLVLDDSDSESEVAQLRRRWELASVLNFLRVFEPVIGSDLKLTAEEIEIGLIKPNKAIVLLHVTLLKGIPPVSKTLHDSDAWITLLCKKLAEWWQWVAEDELPLTVSKGEEISKYKELDPMSRLVMLKALCEIRSDQYDAVSYINDGLKQGKDVSCFCKVNVGESGNGTSYWYDGDDTIGHRLYRELNSDSKKKTRGKARSVPTVCFEWETLATNVEGFRKVVDGLSSSKVETEVLIGKNIDATIIPLVEKLQKRKERALKRKQKEEMLLNSLRNFVSNRTTRSCRNRKPISYTFDEYDQAIDDAIQTTKKRKSVQSQEEKQERNISNGGLDTDTTKDNSGRKNDSVPSNSENNKLQEVFHDENGEDNDYEGKNDQVSGSGDSDFEKNYPSTRNQASSHTEKLPRGARWSKRLAGDTLSAAETTNFTTKNTSRQRPMLNSAVDLVVPDSDD